MREVSKIKIWRIQATASAWKKRQIEITGGSMLNGIQERGINKDQNTKTKLFKYPGIFSINTLDIIKPNFKKRARWNYYRRWNQWRVQWRKLLKECEENCKTFRKDM